LPLLHDHHSHTGLYMALDSCPSILGMSKEAAVNLLLSMDRDRLNLVTGWRSDVFYPEPKLLQILPPVLLVNFSLHGFVLSDAAVPLLKDFAPDLATHATDGAWLESHVPALFEAYSEQAGIPADGLSAQFSKLAALGIGSTEDMAVPSARIVECVLDSPYHKRLLLWAAPALYTRLTAAHKDAIHGLKLFLDGSIGARSAALSASWIGAWNPVMAYTDERLLEELGALACYKKALSMHAIGDRAIEQAIRAIERAQSSGIRFPSIRLEHVQFISREQAQRARNIGIILSMQPNFTSDSVDYADRLQPALLAANNPFRMLIDDCGFIPGKDLVFGSDGMPHGIEYAATQSLFPPFDGQRLSLEELVAGYGVANGDYGTFTIEVDEAARSVRKIQEL
ncbi:MAG TPA: amidohydrolase family protein, partial [Spirochaetales bacterium]|nr:amidohydrolase family protein [Spirochaetales bacterium]